MGGISPRGALARRRPGAIIAKAKIRAASLSQIRAFGAPGIKHHRHFGSANIIPLREVARIGAFIGDLDRRTQLLDHDIAAYPVLATALTERRDNLLATIAMLEQRLASLRGQPNKLPA